VDVIFQRVTGALVHFAHVAEQVVEPLPDRLPLLDVLFEHARPLVLGAVLFEVVFTHGGLHQSRASIMRSTRASADFWRSFLVSASASQAAPQAASQAAAPAAVQAAAPA